MASNDTFVPRESIANSLAANGKYITLIISKDRHQVRAMSANENIVSSELNADFQWSIDQWFSLAIEVSRARASDPRKRIRRTIFLRGKRNVVYSRSRRESINPRNNVGCPPSLPTSFKVYRCDPADQAHEQACYIIYICRDDSWTARCTNSLTHIAWCSTLRITEYLDFKRKSHHRARTAAVESIASRSGLRRTNGEREEKESRFPNPSLSYEENL